MPASFLIRASMFASAAAGLGGTARAQNEPVNPAAPERREIQESGEIIVTATRREQPLQRAPLAVTALGGQQLEDLGATEFSDYSRLVPGLTAVDRGPGQRKYVLRGINSETAPRLAPIVQQYLNEFPVTLVGGFQPDIRLYDVDRVEILRGPQGTLFGSSSMGGTIRTITRTADLSEFEGQIEGTLSATENGGTNFLGHLIANLPIVEDVLGVRAVVFGENQHGYIDNVGVGREDENYNHATGGRVTVGFRPTPWLRFDLLYLHQRVSAGGQNEVMTGYQAPPFGPPPFLPPGTPWYPTLASPLGDLEVLKGISEYQRDRNDIVNLTARADLADLTFVSSTTYYQRHRIFEQDLTELQGFGGYLRNDEGTDVWSQELRLSDDAGAFKWLIGGYYLRAEQDAEENFQAAFFPNGAQFFRAGNDTRREQQALFAEASYDLLPGLTTTVGIRYGEESFSSTSLELAPNFLTGAPAGARGAELSGSDDAITYKFQVSYLPNDNVTLYAVASSGFRGGGFNDTSLAPTVTPPIFESDTLWNYEAGAKLYLFDRRATWNTALFYIDWSNIQVTAFASPPFGPPGSVAYTANAGGAEIYGLESEFSIRATDRLTLGLSASYISAQLSEDQPAPPPGAPPPRAGLPGRAGDRLPNVPHLTGSMLVNYTAPIGNTWQAFATAVATYSGSSFTAFRPTDPVRQRQDDYALVNLRAGIGNGDWRFTLFVNNLFDTRAQLFINNLSGLNKTTVNRPRTVGLTVNRQF